MQKVWKSNYSLTELQAGAAPPCSLADTAPKAAPTKEIPAPLFLQGTGDSLALGESSQVLEHRHWINAVTKPTAESSGAKEKSKYL